MQFYQKQRETKMLNKFCLCTVCTIFPICANALSYNSGKFDFGLTGYGTIGIIEPKFDKVPKLVGDFRLRTQATYEANNNHKFGAVYMVDEIATEEDKWWHEAFGFWQWRGVGRVEIGLTDSVAHKLGLGLPDVGGLRINHDSLIYKKMGTPGPVISDPTITTGSESLRANIVAAHSSNLQYGVSFSGLTGDYDYEIDAGIKIKNSSAKTKFALSVGASYMNHPDEFSTDTFTPSVSADWRGQIYTGLNIQYNSLVLGITGRVIYDENPIGTPVDGFVAGAGASYDILNYTLSLSYLFSDTGLWHDNAEVTRDHTTVASFRYKYSQDVDGWMSLGMSRTWPFLAAGIRIVF